MRITSYILPVVSGAMAGVILITLGEMGLHHIYPLPPGINMNDMKAVSAALDSMPMAAFLLLLANYALCSLAAGVIATLVAGRRRPLPALVVGIALTLAGLFNIMMLPQPLWFAVVNLMCYIPFAYLGFLIVRRQEPQINRD